MYLQANPSKARTEQEKGDTNAKYTPGENVLPRVRRRKENVDEAEDRRMVEEVRRMSLQEVGIRGSGSYERGTRHRVRDGARDRRTEDDRHRRRREASPSASHEEARPSTPANAASRARHIEHQSSLRSLISTSDLDSSETEVEEILRQIMDEGILDGIDLNNIDVSREDELSEKIADAYRRRHGRRPRSRDDRSEHRRDSTPPEQRPSPQEQRHHRRPDRSPNPTGQPIHSSHPPVSRPHLLEAYPTGRHRRRTSSETRRQTSPNPPRSLSETQRHAAHSATDLSNRPQSSSDLRSRPFELTSNTRRTTNSDTIVAQRANRNAISQRARAPSQSLATDLHRADSPSSTPRTTSQTLAAISSALDASSANSTIPSIVPSAADPTPSSAPTQYPEPLICCARCGKSHLEYELHQNCKQCNEGRYNLCLHCWRLGRGCLHWYGFGHSAMIRWDREAASRAGRPPEHPFPHFLTGHRYLHPPTRSQLQPLAGQQPATASIHSEQQPIMTTSDPSKRLQSGLFCANCKAFAPECFWECDICNDGEWGFCNDCVNQGRCCTHPLLPVSYPCSATPTGCQHTGMTEHASSTSFTPIIKLDQPRSTQNPFSESHIPLTFSTKCDICTNPIPPATTRFHCPQCNGGNSDICTTCYLRLVKNGKITAENGPKGWRRCPNGHRMIIIGFEASVKGQRRTVYEGLVGGHAFKDPPDLDEGQRMSAKTATTPVNTTTASDSNSHQIDNAIGRYPPSGGIGMRVLARWSWWPQGDDADGQLAFPRGAEICECVDINDDWFWGIYCGNKGVFPANYGMVFDVVGMEPK